MKLRNRMMISGAACCCTMQREVSKEWREGEDIAKDAHETVCRGWVWGDGMS